MWPAAIATLLLLTPTLIPPSSLAQEPSTAQPSTRRIPKRQTHVASGVVFETPLGFSEVKSLGNDTVGVVAQKDSRALKIRMAILNPEWPELLNMADEELLSYAKTTYLGINAPAREYHQRRFLGQTLTGEVQYKRTNRGYTVVEIYLLPLSNGAKVVLALEADTDLPLPQVEYAFRTVSQTMREDPEFLKKIKKKR
jgi:hypothetical protein